MKPNPVSQIRRTDWWVPEEKEAGGGDKTGKGNQEEQTFSYEINQPRGCDAQHRK